MKIEYPLFQKWLLYAVNKIHDRVVTMQYVFIITFLKGQRNFADMNDTDTLGLLGGPIEHTPIPKRFGSSRIFINVVIDAAG